MHFNSRRLVMPSDLNYANALFGGRALEWIDEAAVIYAICKLQTNCLVTKKIGEVIFESSAMVGDVVEFGLNVNSVGCSSITVTCLMREQVTKKTICVANDIVLVHVDPISRLPTPHKKTFKQLVD